MAITTHPVELTLKSLGSGDDINERKLLLFPNDFFPVGRASKSIAKKLLAEHDNAWIDSPVISRNHAQFTIGSPSGKVYIRDNGSMHGTIVNMKLVQKHENHELRIGDVVQFGISVVRGAETFAAPKFLIDYKPLAASTTAEGPASQSTQASTKRRLTGYAAPESESSDEASEAEGEVESEDDSISGDDSRSSAILQQEYSRILFPNKPEGAIVSAPGSQANPVTIVDDIEIVHDSVLVGAEGMQRGARVKDIEVGGETNRGVADEQDVDTATPFTSYKQPSYASEDEVSESDDGEHVCENSMLSDEDSDSDNLEDDTVSDFSEAGNSLIMPSDRSQSAEVGSAWDTQFPEVTQEDLLVFDDFRSTQADVDARVFENMESVLERNQDLLDAPCPENRDVRNKLEDTFRQARSISEMNSTIPTPFENDRGVGSARPVTSLSGSEANAYTSLPSIITTHTSHSVSLPSLLGRTDTQAAPRTDVSYPPFPANAELFQNRNPVHWHPPVRDLDFAPFQRPFYSGPVFNLPHPRSVLGGDLESSTMDNFGAPPVYFAASDPVDQTRPLQTPDCPPTSGPAPLLCARRTRMEPGEGGAFRDDNAQASVPSHTGDSLAAFRSTSTSKTGISIPEIVEGVIHASDASPASRKRKANEMMRDVEELSQGAACASAISHVVNAIRSESDISTSKQSSHPKVSGATSSAVTSDMPPASEPSAKRVKLGYVATAAAGALVGGIGMLATLVSLPDTFFQ